MHAGPLAVTAGKEEFAPLAPPLRLRLVPCCSSSAPWALPLAPGDIFPFCSILGSSLARLLLSNCSTHAASCPPFQSTLLRYAPCR
eukprot:m.51091 g.51091  ORF g.51091 m.51091 type:complete len:86 (+) comp6586_c0_seq1:394-651(+)